MIIKLMLFFLLDITRHKMGKGQLLIFALQNNWTVLKGTYNIGNYGN